jgi:urease beta subunit
MPNSEVFSFLLSTSPQTINFSSPASSILVAVSGNADRPVFVYSENHAQTKVEAVYKLEGDRVNFVELPMDSARIEIQPGPINVKVENLSDRPLRVSISEP